MMKFIALTNIISYKFFSGTLAIVLLRCTLRCLISIHVEINETTDICFGMNAINESYGEEYNTTENKIILVRLSNEMQRLKLSSFEK